MEHPVFVIHSWTAYNITVRFSLIFWAVLARFRFRYYQFLIVRTLKCTLLFEVATLNNIPILLSLLVVQFYCCHYTSQMRYDNIVKHFGLQATNCFTETGKYEPDVTTN